MTAFPYINQIALVGDTVDGAVGGVDVLIKIAEKNHSNALCLLKLYKFDKIVAESVSRICVRLVLAMKRSFLLVIRSDALRVGWLLAGVLNIQKPTAHLDAGKDTLSPCDADRASFPHHSGVCCPQLWGRRH
jgi:hypothetical protein